MVLRECESLVHSAGPVWAEEVLGPEIVKDLFRLLLMAWMEILLAVVDLVHEILGLMLHVQVVLVGMVELL
jgi:hypothetical protein